MILKAGMYITALEPLTYHNAATKKFTVLPKGVSGATIEYTYQGVKWVGVVLRGIQAPTPNGAFGLGPVGGKLSDKWRFDHAEDQPKGRRHDRSF